MLEQRVVDITKDFLERMGYENTLVEVFKDSQNRLQVKARIKGDVGMLIGKGGDTLRAVQHLLLLIVSKQLDTRFGAGEFMFDVNDYQLERENYLISLAKNTAHEVRETKIPHPLEIMPASERRIIHVTLQEERDVRTESEGERGARRVIVRPV